MGDFLLDLRPPAERGPATQQGAALFCFCPDTRVETLECTAFTLVLSRVDDPQLWGAFQGQGSSEGLLVALAGRVALEPLEWESARQMDGPGGLASKAIVNRYRQHGIQGLESLNGNFVVILHDAQARKLHLVTDRAGMCLAYGREPQSLVFCSHPDVLAAVLGEGQNLDRTSLSEFLLTGRLTFPFTYYHNIRALQTGCVHTIAWRDNAPALESKRSYFTFEFQNQFPAPEGDLAAQLAEAFRHSVRRRSLSLFGKTAVGLSGGLDSRAILAARAQESPLEAFCLYDEDNPELLTAQAIADTAGVKLIRIQRDPEYYGHTMELGARISGGTGCLASNHFLGARDRLTRLGFTNLLTGCHCDYLFKGLALNKSEHPVTRRERLDSFQLEFYRPCYWPDTQERQKVETRLRHSFPEAHGTRLSAETWQQVERRRTFPLAYEADLAQRVIPQRVLPWYPLMADTDILDVYLRIPSRFKLNASLFRKMLGVLCDRKLSRVPDSNIGAPVNASWPRFVLHRYWTALQNRLATKVLSRLASRGSWPNWEYYVHHSDVLRSLWLRKNSAARDLFRETLGTDPWARPMPQYQGRDVELFLRLLTQKLWLDQRL